MESNEIELDIITTTVTVDTDTDMVMDTVTVMADHTEAVLMDMAQTKVKSRKK